MLVSCFDGLLDVLSSFAESQKDACRGDHVGRIDDAERQVKPASFESVSACFDKKKNRGKGGRREICNVPSNLLDKLVDRNHGLSRFFVWVHARIHILGSVMISPTSLVTRVGFR